MEKSRVLSNAANLAFLVIIASCCSFSLAARELALAELEYEPAPVDGVPPQDQVLDQKCSTDKDCKTLPGCIVGMHKCVSGTCKCLPFKPPQAPPPAFTMGTENQSCTTVEDCDHTICINESGVHLRCIDGVCRCVPDGSSPVTKSKAGDGCPETDCKLYCVGGCPERVQDVCHCVVPPSSF